MSTKHTESNLAQLTTDDVRAFWQKNPLCSNGIPHPLGSREFFEVYDGQREGIESILYSYALHEYRDFKGKKVLDVGSGNGYVLSKYAAEGAEVFGIDITQAGIDLCRKRFDHLNLKGNFQVADAQALPFPDNTFDCVCSMGVLHHVPDTQKAIEEIYRVIKPGGRLIVMFYHRNSAKYQLKYRVWSWVTGKSMQQLVNEFDGIGNPKGTVFSKKQLNAMLSRFTEVKMQVGYLETRDVILRGARHLPDNLFKLLAPLLGWNLYAKGRKPK
jgi:ubiquinone/menaquinone biosynthesis C-methylase UbiE